LKNLPTSVVSNFADVAEESFSLQKNKIFALKTKTANKKLFSPSKFIISLNQRHSIQADSLTAGQSALFCIC